MIRIETQTNYVITFTEHQAKELLQLLRTEKDSGCLGVDSDLRVIYDELCGIGFE